MQQGYKVQTKPSDKSVRPESTKVREDGFGEILEESAGVEKASRRKCEDLVKSQRKAPMLEFFLSSCRARSRLWRSSKRLVVGQLYSQVVREQVKCKKPNVFRMPKQNKPQNTKHQPNTKRKKTSRKQSETLRFQNNEIFGALSTSSRRHSDSRK